MVNKKADRRCGGFPRQAEDMTEKKVAQTQFGCEEGGAESERDRETLGPNFSISRGSRERHAPW